jgi:hypothetical protein
VDVHYLGRTYEVLVPQVGRFILGKGLGLKIGRQLNPKQIFDCAQDLMGLWDLLVPHEELQDECLDDFLEIRPPALIKEFIRLLKQNGPGTILWESAQRLYLQRHLNSKIVDLTRWHWNFLPSVVRLLEKPKDPAS